MCQIIVKIPTFQLWWHWLRFMLSTTELLSLFTVIRIPKKMNFFFFLLLFVEQFILLHAFLPTTLIWLNICRNKYRYRVRIFTAFNRSRCLRFKFFLKNLNWHILTVFIFIAHQNIHSLKTFSGRKRNFNERSFDVTCVGLID